LSFHSLPLRAAALALAPRAHAAADAPLPWDDAKQLVLVVVPGWDTNTGTLQEFERGRNGWKPVAAAADVAIGHNGAAWGTGLHPQQTDGPQKKEGDGRAPAGVFGFGDAFGYAPTAKTKMPYLALTETQYCVDVMDSPLYNTIVDAKVAGADAVEGSTEPMRRDIHADGDQRYRDGLVIGNNPRNVPGLGSCIFAHLWKAPGEPTTGCTAMAPATMDKLLAWLEPKKHPVFVLLPRAEYERLKTQWRLP
jgi:L,D-peptidoglycan transpeptidase YkuD (ErfK/YbiS/YcfS/YnhG family)